MKKVNNRFSLDSLANKVALNKVEMQAIKGGDFTCYCNGSYVGSYNNVNSCISAC